MESSGIRKWVAIAVAVLIAWTSAIAGVAVALHCLPARPGPTLHRAAYQAWVTDTRWQGLIIQLPFMMAGALLTGTWWRGGPFKLGELALLPYLVLSFLLVDDDGRYMGVVEACWILAGLALATYVGMAALSATARGALEKRRQPPIG